MCEKNITENNDNGNKNNSNSSNSNSNSNNNSSSRISTLETAWCPGCGNFAILDAIKESLQELELNPNDVIIFGGIGQAAKTPQYLNVNGFSGLHGRALPPAIAAKISNHKMKVIVSTGDGDSYGEGGNHFIHNVRRNVDITHFVHDNQIYGLTKGQSSPTSNLGHVTDFTPDGVINQAMNPILTAISMGAGFVARAFTGDKEQLKDIMKQAIMHNGYALVDILQPCVTFNKVNTFAWYKKRVYKVDETDENYDCTDRLVAMKKSLEWGEKIPTGIIYREEKKSFTDNFSFLKENTLVSSTFDSGIIKEFINEFI